MYMYSTGQRYANNAHAKHTSVLRVCAFLQRVFTFVIHTINLLVVQNKRRVKLLKCRLQQRHNHKRENICRETHMYHVSCKANIGTNSASKLFDHVNLSKHDMNVVYHYFYTLQCIAFLPDHSQLWSD